MNTSRTIACPNCKSNLELHHAQTQSVGCEHCRAVFDTDGTNATLVSTHERMSVHYTKPRSFIKLHQIAIFDGRQYRVIGRMVWYSNYKEYWRDDEGEGYSDETWHYHEWILSDDNGGVLYLFEDDEGYHFAESIEPQYPNLSEHYTKGKDGAWLNPKKDKYEIKSFTTDRTKRVLEIGQSALQFMEGEAPWPAHIGDVIGFATYEHEGARYTVETDIGEQNPNEGEYFKEQNTSKRYLMQSFAANADIAQVVAEGQADEKEYNFWTKVMGVFTAICMFMYLAFASSGGGSLIRSQTFEIPPIRDTTQIMVAPVRIGALEPFTLERGPIEVSIKANLPVNSNLWAGVEIRDAADLPISTLDEQFYDEQGTEYWQEEGESGYEDYHEQQVSKESLYRVDTPGTYTAEVFVAPQSLKQTSVTVTIRRGVMSGGWFMAGILGGLFITALIILIGYVSMPWRM